MQVHDITWTVESSAYAQIRGLPPEVHQNYQEIKQLLKETVCAYFNASANCDAKTHGISRVGSLPDGGKAIKVRCALPGRAASRSLRVMIGAYCEIREVVILEVEWRRDLE